MKKIALEICGFVLVLSILIGSVTSSLRFKYGDGILNIEYLYAQEEDSIDVMFLGSSHVFENINTGVLFEDYGVASYVLAGSVQPFWNTYYYLTEALKTQTPKLIVLEGFAATQNYDYSRYDAIIKNNFGFKNPVTRIESLKVSSPQEDFLDYLFGYRYWHSRYNDINESDFSEYYTKPIYAYYKGFGINWETMSFEMPDVDSVNGKSPISKKQEKYFRMIIELCQEKNIPIMVIVSPYVLSAKEQQNYNYLQSITEEYGVPFINYNSSQKYTEMGLDFSTGMADDGHLNYIGNIKYTKYIAEDILNTFDLPDRRSNPNYDSWKMNSKDISERTEDFYLSKSTDTHDFIDRLKNNEDHICYIYSVSQTRLINEKCELLSSLSQADVEAADGNLYCFENNTLLRLSQSPKWEYSRKIDNKYLLAEFCLQNNNEEINIKNEFSYGGIPFIGSQKGIYIMVYNTFTHSLVCVKQMELNSDGEVILNNII